MKVLHVSDVHLDFYATRLGSMKIENGENVYHKERVQRLKSILETGVEQKVELIIVTGDLHNKSKPPPKEYADLFEVLDIVPQNIPILVIPGNHDEVTSRGCALQPLAGRRPNIFVALKIATIEWRGVTVVLAPWGTPVSEIEEWCKDLKDRHILAYHTGVLNGQLNWGEVADEKATCELNSLINLGFDHVMLGHYHGQGPLDPDRKIWYAGSPECFNFGEQDQMKGYLIWDLETKTASPMPTTHPYFVTLKSEDLLAGKERLPVSDGFYVRIQGEVDEIERAKIVDICKEHKNVKFDLKNKLKQERLVSIKGISNQDILAKYFTLKKVPTDQQNELIPLHDEIERSLKEE